MSDNDNDNDNDTAWDDRSGMTARQHDIARALVASQGITHHQAMGVVRQLSHYINECTCGNTLHSHHMGLMYNECVDVFIPLARRRGETHDTSYYRTRGQFLRDTVVYEPAHIMVSEPVPDRFMATEPTPTLMDVTHHAGELMINTLNESQTLALTEASAELLWMRLYRKAMDWVNDK
jgi:hypothetical protein